MWYRLRRLMNATIGVEDVSSDLRFGGIKNPGMSSTPQDGEFEFSPSHFVLGALKTAYVTRLDCLH